MAERRDRGAFSIKTECNCPGCARKLRRDFTYHVYLGEDAGIVAFYPVCPECLRIRQAGTVYEKEKLFERCGQSIYLEYFNWLFG